MRRQEINLYRSIEAPKSKVFLTWKKFWLVNGLVFTYLIFVYFFSLYDLYHLKKSKLLMQKQVTQLEKNFFRIKKAYPSIFFSSDLPQSINNLKKELAAEEALLNRIINRTLFSQKIVALAQVIVPNVWLTEISFINSGQEIILKGKGIGMENVHTFMSNLIQEKKFSGYSLNINNIENLDKNNINNFTFEIQLAKNSK